MISVGLVKFLQFSLTLCGGREGVVSYCNGKNILLPIGSPPLVCFFPCKKPKVTKKSLSLVILGPYFLLFIKSLILCVDIIYLAIDYIPEDNFLSLDNLHNILSFPVGLVAIYCLNIYLVIINDCLTGNNKRFLGLVLLLEFILFDCLKLFFIFLTGIFCFWNNFSGTFLFSRYWYAYMRATSSHTTKSCGSSQKHH